MFKSHSSRSIYLQSYDNQSLKNYTNPVILSYISSPYPECHVLNEWAHMHEPHFVFKNDQSNKYEIDTFSDWMESFYHPEKPDSCFAPESINYVDHCGAIVPTK